jgi:hypothetical protein
MTAKCCESKIIKNPQSDKIVISDTIKVIIIGFGIEEGPALDKNLNIITQTSACLKLQDIPFFVQIVT